MRRTCEGHVPNGVALGILAYKKGVALGMMACKRGKRGVGAYKGGTGVGQAPRIDLTEQPKQCIEQGHGAYPALQSISEQELHTAPSASPDAASEPDIRGVQGRCCL